MSVTEEAKQRLRIIAERKRLENPKPKDIELSFWAMMFDKAQEDGVKFDPALPVDDHKQEVCFLRYVPKDIIAFLMTICPHARAEVYTRPVNGVSTREVILFPARIIEKVLEMLKLDYQKYSSLAYSRDMIQKARIRRRWTTIYRYKTILTTEQVEEIRKTYKDDLDKYC